MAKVTVTALQTLEGDYGRVTAGGTITIDEKAAKRLAKAGVVQMEGVVNEGVLEPQGIPVTAKDAPAHTDSDKTKEPVKKKK